jgi:hypothetical protein
MFVQNTNVLKTDVSSRVTVGQIVQGMYWTNNTGCLTHPGKARAVNEAFFDMPLPLIRICEDIFGGLAENAAVRFFADVSQAIGHDKKDLSLVQWQFLRDTFLRLPEITPETQTVIDGLSLLADGKEWNSKDAAYAAAAAYCDDTADNAAAVAAARAADYAANTDYAEYSMAAAENAVDYARAARYAANTDDVDYAAERLKQAQSIIQLLKNAPKTVQQKNAA